ncbi:MAG: hypothetical protein V3V20_02365 [Algisphaera sp.]
MTLTPPPTTETPDLRTLRGAALRAARNAAALSARDLADRINLRTSGSDITQHAIYAYESGKVLLSREMGVRVAQALSLHPGELLAGEPDFKQPTSPANASQAHSPEAARWLKLAQASLPVANVAARLLGTRMLGDSRIDGFLQVFHLLLTDLTAATTSPLTTVLDGPTGRDQANDAATAVLTACRDLNAATESALENLVQPNPSPVAAHKACSAAANALRSAADQLAECLIVANKAYGVAE